MSCRLRTLLLFLFYLASAVALPAQTKPEEYRDFRAELILAIEERDVQRARQVIREGADREINRGDPSPLGEAIRLDNLQMVALFLRSGGDPNGVRDRPFKEAFRNDSIDMVRLLYQVGARLEEDELPGVLQVTLRGENALALYRELLAHGAGIDLALRVAVENRKLEATRLCLERGADVSSLGELDVLNLNGLEPEMFLDFFDEAVNDDHRDAALSYFLGLAAARGNRELLNRVLAEGGRVSLGHLEKAEAQGEDETALFLLEQMGEELPALIEQAESENRTELAAYLKGLRRERIGSVVGPAIAVVASLFVLAVLAFFLRKHVLQSPTKLHDAIARGRLEALEKLLGAGADPNGTVRGEPLLHAAVARANVKAVRLLLRNQADVDRPAEEPAPDSGLTALHLAARKGNVNMATLLLRNGARADAHTPDGLTPLYYAAGGGHGEMMHLLVERGADLNAPVHEQTMLLHAAGRRDHQAVKMLLEVGADPNADRGKTALHTAATLGDTELVRALLEAGADPYAVDVDGRTALDLATFHRHVDVAQALQSTPVVQGAVGGYAASPAVPTAPAAFPPSIPTTAVAPSTIPPAPPTAFETMVIPPPDPPASPPPVAAPPTAQPPAAQPPAWTPQTTDVDSFTIPLPGQVRKPGG